MEDPPPVMSLAEGPKVWMTHARALAELMAISRVHRGFYTGHFTLLSRASCRSQRLLALLLQLGYQRG